MFMNTGLAVNSMRVGPDIFTRHTNRPLDNDRSRDI